LVGIQNLLTELEENGAQRFGHVGQQCTEQGQGSHPGPLVSRASILHDGAQIMSVYIYIYIYRVSQEEWTKLGESVSYVKIYRYNPKHLYPKLNGYGDNGKRSLKV